MIKHVNGNIFNHKGLICHQVNCRGVMGAGLAKQIRDKFPDVYKDYVKFVKSKRAEELIGDVLWTNKILNLFSQLNYGRDKQQTDYDALDKCIQRVYEIATGKDNPTYTYDIGIPYGMGCGLAGGDWNIVSRIIEKYFKDSDVDCVIYKL